MSHEFRVLFPVSDIPIAKYDPLKIHFSNQYNFFANIYSPLIEYNQSGEIVSGLAERFEWIGNEARFTIRPVKTIDGHFNVVRSVKTELSLD